VVEPAEVDEGTSGGCSGNPAVGGVGWFGTMSKLKSTMASTAVLMFPHLLHRTSERKLPPNIR
jgi:hypothetical protein